MNLRRWTKDHTIGLILGLITPIFFIPVTIWIYSFIEHISFSKLFDLFRILNCHLDNYINDMKGKFISLACIANLGWFHLNIKKQNYNRGMGIILSTMLYLLVILYYKFVA